MTSQQFKKFNLLKIDTYILFYFFILDSERNNECIAFYNSMCVCFFSIYICGSKHAFHMNIDRKVDVLGAFGIDTF